METLKFQITSRAEFERLAAANADTLTESGAGGAVSLHPQPARRRRDRVPVLAGHRPRPFPRGLQHGTRRPEFPVDDRALSRGIPAVLIVVNT